MHIIYHTMKLHNKLLNSKISSDKLQFIMTQYTILYASATLDTV